MAKDSQPSSRNTAPAHPSRTDDERWKSSPSTETTGDQGKNAGKNAEIQRERKIEENAPRGRPTVRGHAVVYTDGDE